MKTVEEQGYTVIGGDVDGADAFEKSPKWVASDVVSHVRPGSIVVLHMHGGPNAPATAGALPDIVTRLRSEGYTFVKVSDLLKLPAGEPIKRAPRCRGKRQPQAPPSRRTYFPLLHFFRR